MRFSPDGHEFLTSGNEDRIRLWQFPWLTVTAEFKVPENKSITLEAFLALDPQVWNEPSGHGVQFLVQAELADNVVKRLYSQHIDPARNGEERRWIPIRLDLSQ